MPTEGPLANAEAKARLVRCISAGSVHLSRHFRRELANDNLVMGDVLTVCRSGAVIQPPERDIRRAEWLYRIEGQTADDEHIAIVFKIVDEEHAVLITVWKER